MSTALINSNCFCNRTLGDTVHTLVSKTMFYRQTHIFKRYLSTALINSNCFRNRTLGDTVHTLVSKTMFYRQTYYKNMSTALIGNGYFRNGNPGWHSACIPFPESMFYRQIYYICPLRLSVSPAFASAPSVVLHVFRFQNPCSIDKHNLRIFSILNHLT